MTLNNTSLYHSITYCLLVVILLSGCASVAVDEQKARLRPADVKKLAAQRLIDTELSSEVKLVDSEDYLLAEERLLAISTLYPDWPGPYANLGIVYTQSGRYEEAEAAFLSALKIKIDDASVYNHMAIMYRLQGKFDQALAYYHRAISVDPQYVKAHLNLGILYDLYLQQPRQALGHYEVYQTLTKDKDKTVALWVLDLKRRLK